VGFSVCYAFPLIHPTLESTTPSDNDKRKPLDVDGLRSTSNVVVDVCEPRGRSYSVGKRFGTERYRSPVS
jgi:hypothetical protein